MAERRNYLDLSGEKTRKRSRSWSGKKMEVEKLPTLEAGERKAVLVTHDESTMEVTKFFGWRMAKRRFCRKAEAYRLLLLLSITAFDLWLAIVKV